MEKYELEGAFDIKRTGIFVREWEKRYFALNDRLKSWTNKESFTNSEEALEEWECKFVQDVTFGAGKSKGNRLDIYFLDGEKLSLKMSKGYKEETLVSWMVALRRHLRSIRQVTPAEWEIVHKKREERLTKQGSSRGSLGSPTAKPPKLKDKLATLLSRKNKNLKPSASSPEISPPSTPDKFFAPTSPISSSSSQESSSSSFILDSSSSASSSSDSNASAYETLPKSVTPIPLTTSVSVSTSTGSMELTDNSKSKKKLNSS